ncbi:hypothetical protein HDF16_003918 [Granulicella aggregans]|uniref:Uncharacterized protein n=1 Tax=Granulicella aggregans TaxID=474949 RepID=A0A7W8E6F4_9BACT|nr:hypothetical protein [Granulicella aggregans]MBB5059195.1 hypothetical protein [Granulicella aggregans]
MIRQRFPVTFVAAFLTISQTGPASCDSGNPYPASGHAQFITSGYA